MVTFPAIDMEATGQNITKLRKDAGLTVRDLQGMFGFTTPQAIYKWQKGTAMPIHGVVSFLGLFLFPVRD